MLHRKTKHRHDKDSQLLLKDSRTGLTVSHIHLPSELGDVELAWITGLCGSVDNTVAPPLSLSLIGRTLGTMDDVSSSLRRLPS